MAQHPLSASRIVATAEDIVSADHQFLMSTGTLVHHETFNIEAIRRDLEQLIAERVCLRSPRRQIPAPGCSLSIVMARPDSSKIFANYAGRRRTLS